MKVSAATVSRYLSRAGLVTPEPRKRPKSSYLRFEAEQPNECWQSDFTHYPLADGTGTEIVTWLDDHSRYALSVTAHQRVTGPIVLATFRAAVAAYGAPASTLTDNGMVFTTRFSGGRGGRNGLETELRRRRITQKNGHMGSPYSARRGRHVWFIRWPEMIMIRLFSVLVAPTPTIIWELVRAAPPRDNIGHVPVQAPAGPVIPHRGPRIGMQGGLLNVAQRDAGIQCRGDEHVPAYLRDWAGCWRYNRYGLRCA